MARPIPLPAPVTTAIDTRPWEQRHLAPSSYGSAFAIRRVKRSRLRHTTEDPEFTVATPATRMNRQLKLTPPAAFGTVRRPVRGNGDCQAAFVC